MIPQSPFLPVGKDAVEARNETLEDDRVAEISVALRGGRSEASLGIGGLDEAQAGRSMRSLARNAKRQGCA